MFALLKSELKILVATLRILSQRSFDSGPTWLFIPCTAGDGGTSMLIMSPTEVTADTTAAAAAAAAAEGSGAAGTVVVAVAVPAASAAWAEVDQSTGGAGGSSRSGGGEEDEEDTTPGVKSRVRRPGGKIV